MDTSYCGWDETRGEWGGMSVWIGLAISAPVLTVCKCSMWSVKGKRAFLFQFLVLSGRNYYWQNHCHLNLQILPISKTEVQGQMRNKGYQAAAEHTEEAGVWTAKCIPHDSMESKTEPERLTVVLGLPRKNHPMLLCLTCKLVGKSLEPRLISVHFHRK